MVEQLLARAAGKYRGENFVRDHVRRRVLNIRSRNMVKTCL